MSKDRRLGRGLAALLGAPLDESGEELTRETAAPRQPKPLSEAAPSAGDTHEAQGGLVYLNVYEIDDNPFQPRRDFGESEIASLAESLKEHDMLQPILVRKVGDRHQLISGERRLRAAIQAGWSSVPARLREADDRLVAELAIVENLQRKDLNPVEKAMCFKRYLEQHGCSQEDLARRLKIDRSTIANLMRLLELPESVQDAMRRGELSAGHARALLPLGDEALQIEFSGRVLAEGLSVRAVETLVQEKIEDEDVRIAGVVGAGASKKRRTRSGQVSSLEQELRLALGTRVEIRPASRGRGRIVVHFSSEEEFDRIRVLLTGVNQFEADRRVG
jgi:ParB family transcriptional regulator, chromosome partitioning protein